MPRRSNHPGRRDRPGGSEHDVQGPSEVWEIPSPSVVALDPFRGALADLTPRRRQGAWTFYRVGGDD